MKSGIQFFPPGTPPGVRRRRLLFLAVWLLACAMVTWPLFPLLGARQVLVFGLPASIAWVIVALAIQFVALLWLYLNEEDGEDDSEGDALNLGS